MDTMRVGSDGACFGGNREGYPLLELLGEDGGA